jgi:NADH-quinone oxidoreductase subunit L
MGVHEASKSLSFAVSVRWLPLAVAVALLGWFLADLLYRLRPAGRAQLNAALPRIHNLLVHKYYVDEFYSATVVKPLLAVSKYLLGWFVDSALLGGGAWLLGGTARFAGALLQRWQSGNLRSYAAWLAAGAAAVLLFIVVPWAAVWPASLNVILKMAGH